ncbi:protein-tyrosine phosphatase-like protein [Aspergillus varians]
MAEKTSHSAISNTIEIDGVFNARTFGGYPSTLGPKRSTRDGILYRSGHLKDITARGLSQIRTLGISTIIDLTNSGETTVLFSDAAINPGQGCRVLNFPLAKHAFSVQQLAEKYQRYLAEGEKAIAEGYLRLLVEGAEVIRDILFLIRDSPDDVFLVHCAMGKDRTGVVFAVLLCLAGVEHEVVAEDYSRSETALGAALPEISAAIKKALGLVNDDEARERARIVIKTSKEAMLLTLQMVEERFGSMIQYLNKCCGVEMEDIKRIQGVLTSTS